MELPDAGHEPVLLRETMEMLALRPGMVVADCTVGRGGHALAIAERIGPDGLLIALDVDPANLEFARGRLEGMPCRMRFFHANFAELEDVVAATGVQAVDAILADLGPSTNQFFERRYGLSFAEDMPLDMRLDPRIPHTAADVLKTLSEKELADVLYELAQERYARRIARRICGEIRSGLPITTTGRLAQVVRSVIPRRGATRIDPCTRTFLALRAYVNREVENLKVLLEKGPQLLAAGGRMVVISFQSTEDRLVKQAFRALQKSGTAEILTRKPVRPAEAETARNPRSRSALMRAIRKRG